MKPEHIPTGHQQEHISHENGQGHQHDHTGFENGVGHQKFHDLGDTNGPPMEGLFLSAEETMMNDENLMDETEEDEMDII